MIGGVFAVAIGLAWEMLAIHLGITGKTTRAKQSAAMVRPWIWGASRPTCADAAQPMAVATLHVAGGVAVMGVVGHTRVSMRLLTAWRSFRLHLILIAICVLDRQALSTQDGREQSARKQTVVRTEHFGGWRIPLVSARSAVLEKEPVAMRTPVKDAGELCRLFWRFEMSRHEDNWITDQCAYGLRAW